MRRLQRLLSLGMMGGGGAEADLFSKNLPDALAVFSAACASGSARCLLYPISDSIGVGYNSTGCTDAGGANSWANLLAAAIRTKYGLGTGVVYHGNNAAWAEAGTWANSNNNYSWVNGFMVNRGRMSSEAGATTTIALTGSRFDLYYYRYNQTGIFQVSVDGGAAENIDAGGTPAAVVRSFDLAHGEHTFVLSVPAGKYCWLDAMHVHAANSLTVYNKSAGGAKISTHQPTSNPIAKIDVIPADIAKLFVVALSTNDYGGQTALATYTTQLTALVDYLKTRGDVLIVAENWQTQQLAIPQIQYDKICQSLAAGNVGTIRMAVRWGTAAEAIASGYVTEASGVHPNDTGHVDYKDQMLAFI